MASDILIIGYGNTLRGDDGIGPAVVNGVAALEIPAVSTLVVHQLAPELAAELCDAKLVIFVDAHFGGEGVSLTRIDERDGVESFTHLSDPRSLVALARATFGKCPPAYILSASGLDFDYGEGLSSVGRENAANARERVERILSEWPSLVL